MIQPNDTVVLPIGLEIDGVRYKTVRISEMNGYDEENLASRKVRNNGAKGQSILLRRCIQEIEGLFPRKDNPNELIKDKYVLDMCSYDRDFLFFSIRSLGGVPDIDLTFECTSCGTDNTTTASVEDLEVYEWPEEEAFEIPFEMKNGIFQDGVMHKEGVWRFLSGKQQEQLAKVNSERLLSASMVMCIYRLGEMQGTPTEEQFKRLSTTERTDILEQIAREAPGVQTTLKLSCDECGLEQETALDVSRFFKSAASPSRTQTSSGRPTRRRLRRH
jgi:hypothetical protein